MNKNLKFMGKLFGADIFIGNDDPLSYKMAAQAISHIPVIQIIDCGDETCSCVSYLDKIHKQRN